MKIILQDGKPQNIATRQRIGRGLELPIGNRDVKNMLYSFYKKEVKKRKREFVFTNGIRNAISIVGDFLTLETDYYGLFMPGSTGNGKTTMLKAIKDVIVFLTDCGKLNFCEGDKYPILLKARNMASIMIEDKDEFRTLKNTRYLLIDDLGTEPTEVKAYGMTYRPFDELLDHRYEMMLPTIISSNLTADDVVEKYNDNRIVDRMSEMFKILSFEEESFR